METTGAETSASRPRPRPRDRRGRGLRGPARLPEVPGIAATATSRQRFDKALLRIVRDLDARWADHLGLVEFAVEDTPDLPDDWGVEVIPLATLVRGTATTPSRLVVFRRPIEHRCEDPADLETLLFTAVVERVAELLGLRPDEVDPRYPID